MKGVTEEPEAQRAVDDACDRWPRADEAWEAMTWVLARDPEFGTALDESGRIRSLTLEGARSIGLPTLIVRYRVDAHVVVVERARFSDGKCMQAGRS